MSDATVPGDAIVEANEETLIATKPGDVIDMKPGDVVSTRLATSDQCRAFDVPDWSLVYVLVFTHWDGSQTIYLADGVTVINRGIDALRRWACRCCSRVCGGAGGSGPDGLSRRARRATAACSKPS